MGLNWGNLGNFLWWKTKSDSNSLCFVSHSNVLWWSVVSFHFPSVCFYFVCFHCSVISPFSICDLFWAGNVRRQWYVVHTPVLLSSRKVLVLENPRGPIFKSIVLVLVLELQVLVFVLVLRSSSFWKISRIEQVNIACEISSTIVLQCLSDEWVACLPLCPGRVQVHVDLTWWWCVLVILNVVVVLEESPCPWGPIFKSLSLSLKLDSLSLSSSLSLKSMTTTLHTPRNNRECDKDDRCVWEGQESLTANSVFRIWLSVWNTKVYRCSQMEGCELNQWFISCNWSKLETSIESKTNCCSTEGHPDTHQGNASLESEGGEFTLYVIKLAIHLIAWIVNWMCVVGFWDVGQQHFNTASSSHLYSRSVCKLPWSVLSLLFSYFHTCS